MLKWLKIMLMLHDPRILRVPLRVLRELRRRGIERLPGRSAPKCSVNGPAWRPCAIWPNGLPVKTRPAIRGNGS